MVLLPLFIAFDISSWVIQILIMYSPSLFGIVQSTAGRMDSINKEEVTYDQLEEQHEYLRSGTDGVTMMMIIVMSQERAADLWMTIMKIAVVDF
jgi:hypothetical protein